MRILKGLSILVFALAAAAPAAAQKPVAESATAKGSAPGQAAAARVTKVSASVEAIDAANRVLTLKGPRGGVFDLAVGPEVKNFDQIRVGDHLVVRYLQALTLELKKGGGGIRSRSDAEGSATAQPGERPAAGAARRVTVVADVTAVNKKQQTVTLRGPKRTVELKVRDPEQLKLIKVGDQVEAVYTEAAAISIEPAPKPAAK
jgi:Cu/Ag efflux protein CusF